MQIWCEYGMYLVTMAGPCQCVNTVWSWTESVQCVATCHPTLLCMMAMMMVTLLWTLALLSCQLYQILVLAMTTNERFNLRRYKHFHTAKPGQYVSPFNKGLLINFIQFFCVKSGSLKPKYSLGKKEKFVV